MSESINGWTPPIIYDSELGQSRIATQADVDRLVRIAAHYAEMRFMMRRLLDERSA